VIPGQELEPSLYYSPPDAEPPVKLTVFRVVLSSGGAKDDNVKVFGEQRELFVDLANISKEVDNMSTVFQLLAANLKEATT
jgi:hypothetical protein